MQKPFDVLIIGAGLSGIGMACHIQRDCPDQRYAILERRSRIGGTWDLFRYPGIRSDSDMFTFGYAFRPWNSFKVLADGTSIREYVTETAKEYGVDRNIRYGVKIVRADFSTKTNLWTVHALDEASGEEQTHQSRVLVSCTGYYNYDKGFLPDFPGQERFKGTRVHPQFWPENLDYKGKRVVVIGSGATAVTLVPAMADDAAHVTMLQRSPGFIFSVPGIDAIARAMSKFLPQKLVYAITRKRNLALLRAMYFGSLRWPDKARKLLMDSVEKQVGDKVDMKHFTPRYNPWEERLCAVPDGDLFKAMRHGKASVVTAEIESFTETGIRLKDGEELQADIIVTATGLNLQVFGGIQISVDGAVQNPNDHLTYKATLLEGVPNLAWIVGYTNAPWTLKADIASRYICRLLSHMKQHGYSRFVAHAPDDERDHDTIFGSLKSGYVMRAAQTLPRQGKSLPWRVLHDYKRDQPMLLTDPIDDGFLEFSALDQPATGKDAAKIAEAA